jgi:hypothetical protein
MNISSLGLKFKLEFEIFEKFRINQVLLYYSASMNNMCAYYVRTYIKELSFVLCGGETLF